ncbi:amidohydrolase family protein [Vibrio lentus]|nr:amidohydrolase family protein [Vibrio lentus]
MRPVDYLEDVGWLNERTWLAHGIHFNPEEIKRLGKSGNWYQPLSDVRHDAGFCICKNNDLEAPLAWKVGLGVDGSASNDGSNMIAEARMAMYLQRLQYGSANVSH